MAGDSYTLIGLAVPAGLDALHELVQTAGREHQHVPMADLMMFETAVVEIVGNVVEHGRPAGGVHWSFSLSVLPDRIEAALSDDGQAFSDATDARQQMPDALAEDGRGLALAGEVLDVMHYQRDAGTNRWRLVRTLA